MFTGLVEAQGAVRRLEQGSQGLRLSLAVPAKLLTDLALGDSLAVDGLCLTVADIDGDTLGFDVIPESLRRSNLGRLSVGDGVNLERSLQLQSRLGGHLVSGHIDCTGEVRACDDSGTETILEVAVPGEWRRFLFAKGSVALNGVSLTLATVRPEAESAEAHFSVCLIPVTLAETNLGQLSVGDLINVETDQLARYTVETAERLWRDNRVWRDNREG